MNFTLITGASSGIGYEFAHIFAQAGHNLALVARNTEVFAKLQNTYSGIKIISLSQDLTEPNAPQSIYDELDKQGAFVDILVNNAGFGDYGYFHESDIEKQLSMIDLNVKALTHMTYLFGSQMVRKRSGKILNVASTAGFFPGPLMSVYYATKNYVLAFSEGVGEEWSKFGVSVTTLCPGPTASGFQKAADMGASKLFKGKNALPKDVAEYGYDALMKGKRVAIHGKHNKLTVWAARLFPVYLQAKIVKKIQSK